MITLARGSCPRDPGPRAVWILCLAASLTWAQELAAQVPGWTPARVLDRRSQHALAYDAARQRVVLFGGWNTGYLFDTWEWDGGTWSQRSPSASPSARFGHALAYDVARQRVVLFGGQGPTGHLSDTWAPTGRSARPRRARARGWIPRWSTTWSASAS